MSKKTDPPVVTLSTESLLAISNIVSDVARIAVSVPKSVEVTGEGVAKPASKGEVLYSADFYAVGSTVRGLPTERGGKIVGYSTDRKFWSVETELGTWAASVTGSKGLWLTGALDADHASFERYGAVFIPGTVREVQG